MFIVIEGIDGSGKTTLCQKLRDYLESQGKKVALTREPGGTEVAEQLRSYLVHPPEDEPIVPEAQVMLAFAARFQHLARIQQLIDQGYIVISDRYHASTCAYNIALNDMSSSWWDMYVRLARKCLVPDLTFYLKVNIETSIKRIEARGGVLTKHDALSKDQKLKLINGYNWVYSMPYFSAYVIDSNNLNQDEMLQQIIKQLPH